METFLAIVGIVFIIVGVVGCFIPAIPGPPLAYVSLLLLQVGPEVPFTLKFMLLMALFVALVSILDYFIPAFGAKKYGGSRYGMIGAMVGVVLGIFVFPPVGFIIFPLLGAFVGEVLNGANSSRAFKAAIGTFAGLLMGTVIKISLTMVIAYYFFANL